MALLISVLAAALSAHELGSTQAVATFGPDGTYRIDISVDPDALLMKLELASGAAVTEVVEATERDRRITALSRVLVDGLDIRFDGARDRPHVEYLPAPDPTGTQVPGVVRVTGRVPKDVRGWRVSYQFVMGWYALEVRAGDQPARTVWLEGGKPSESLLLSPPPAMGRRLLPKVLPLFVLGLVLITVRGRGSKR